MELNTEGIILNMSGNACSDCKYAINAFVHLKGCKLDNISFGNVFVGEKDDPDRYCVASFTYATNKSLSVNYQIANLTDAQQVYILTLIHEYVASIRTKVDAWGNIDK